MTAIEQAVAFLKEWVAAQRKLEEGVTEGKWTRGGDATIYSDPEGQAVVVADCRSRFLNSLAQVQNVYFILSARTSLPAAVKAIEAAVEEWNRGPDGINGQAERDGAEMGKDAMIFAIASGLGWEERP